LKLLQKIIDHYKEASWFTRITDLLFYALIVALIFPGSRTWVIAHAQRLVMWAPSEKSEPVPLQPVDWSWKVVDVHGNVYSLEDFRGKVIFINFWATWCAPCLAELPAMQDLYEHFKQDTGIVFMFVTDQELNIAYEFLQKKGFHLPVYRMFSSPTGQLAHNTIPSTYLIDRQGRIIAEAHRSKRWNSPRTVKMIRRLIKE